MTQAWAAVYLSASNIPQMLVLEATSDTGSNESVTASEPQVTVLTSANSAPSWSAPDTRNTTLPLQLDEGVKVTATLVIVVPLLVTAVHSVPTEFLAGEVTRYTSAHSPPSEELLLDGLADAVALADAVGPPDAPPLFVGSEPAEALGAAPG